MRSRLADLRNVGAFLGLVDKVVNRVYGLEGMAVFHGASGLGKTTAVTVAAIEFDARWVEVEADWTKKHLLTKILEQYGIKPPRASIAQLTDVVREAMIDHEKPLIIDDAQYALQKGMIETIRSLYKKTECPVILVGEEALPSDLTHWENIHNLQLAWEPAIPCDVSDARRLANIYAPDVGISDDLIKRIVDVTRGSTRRIAHNLADIREKSKILNIEYMNLEAWGERALFSGEPPLSRTRSAATSSVTQLPRKRRAS